MIRSQGLGIVLVSALGVALACGSSDKAEEPSQNVGDGGSGAGGAADGAPEGFTDTMWELANEMSPLPPLPADPTNAYADNAAAAVLGQKLFFETDYSSGLGEDNACGSDCGAVGEVGEVAKMGCAKCHAPSTGFADGRSIPGNTSLGVKWGTRNTPSVVNIAYYDWMGWAGKQDALWTQSSLSPESGKNSAGNRCGYAYMISEQYADEYNAVFTEYPLPAGLAPGADSPIPESCKPKKTAEDADGAWEGMTAEEQDSINRVMANTGKAVAAYERLLVSGNAPFDKYMAGDASALSDSEVSGLRVFLDPDKGNCVACHSGPIMAENKFYNIGVAQVGEHVPEEDKGREKDLGAAQKHLMRSTGDYSDAPTARHGDLASLEPPAGSLGAFKVPALRNIADTAPYLHTGGEATLMDVVEFYVRGGDDSGFVGEKTGRMKVLTLTDQEKLDLVAFLESLSGEPIPEALLADTSVK